MMMKTDCGSCFEGGTMTDEPEFTAGPWRRRELNSTTRVYAPNAMNREICSTHKPLPRHLHNEARANAHLIAAAPDMYAALLSAESYFDQRADADHNGHTFVCNEEMDRLMEIRAALSLARGGKQ